jgi:hypothetical protein
MAVDPKLMDARAFRKQMKLTLRAEAERLEREARGLRAAERALTDKRRPRRSVS